MRIDRRQDLVHLAAGTQVVEQYAHAHAAVGGVDDVAQHRGTGPGRLQDVGLQVKAALRCAGHRQARGQRIGAGRERVEQRLARALREARGQRLAQRRIRGGGGSGGRVGRRALGRCRQAGATGQPYGQCQSQRDRQWQRCQRLQAQAAGIGRIVAEDSLEHPWISLRRDGAGPGRAMQPTAHGLHVACQARYHDNTPRQQVTAAVPLLSARGRCPTWLVRRGMAGIPVASGLRLFLHCVFSYDLAA
ncbi:hypothetical protein D9M70_408880 [compost metagenome]